SRSADLVTALLAANAEEGARTYVRECLARHPYDVRLRVLGAEGAYRTTELATAERLLRQAMAPAPREPAVRLDLGLVPRARGETRESARLLHRVAEGGAGPLAARAKLELERAER